MSIAKIINSSIMPIVYLALIPLLIASLRTYDLFSRFSRSAYGHASGNRFFKTITDKVDFAEFLTFELLESLGEGSRVLTNIYLPTENGKTSKIDLLMVHSTGIYVFEAKNYHGSIYGDDKDRNWTRVQKGGRKSFFYNPVRQNKGHIGALMDNLRDVKMESFFSYIVFSERCELKNIKVSSMNTSVLKRNSLKAALERDISARSKVFGESEISGIYGILSWYSLADDSVKSSQINVIKEDFE